MPAVRPASPGAELTPCSYVAPEGLIAGDPHEREHIYLATADGSYTVGVWEAQPYTEQIDAYPGNEFCTVVRGAVTLTTHDGQAQTFRAGDSFTIEAGWTGQWRVDEPFLKFFAVSTPT
jgi:uncharacterized protein